MQLRQGRSLWLPTLPYQQTNRYAVDGAKLVFHLLCLRIGYPNHYAAVGAMSVFILLCPHIGRTNRYMVVSVIPVFVILRSRIFHTNRYEVVSAIPAFVLLHPHIGHTNHPMVVSTTPLICAWAVMSCLLSRTIYIIRCVAVWNEMVFVGRTSNTQSYKPTLS